MAYVKCKYADLKIARDFLFYVNSNIFTISHDFEGIHSLNVHNFDLDLYNG